MFTAGNSGGDYEMLRWTTSGGGPRYGMMVRRLDRGLTEAPGAAGWWSV